MIGNPMNPQLEKISVNSKIFVVSHFFMRRQTRNAAKDIRICITKLISVTCHAMVRFSAEYSAFASALMIIIG